jgi:hypothetical protein
LWILISEADAKSTWTEAMTKCRQQCSTIESDTTILKQTTQWPNEKGQMDKQRSTKHKHKTKD